MNQHTSFIFSFFAMSSLLLLPAIKSAAAGTGPRDGMTVAVRQDNITILCPEKISYQILPAGDQWDAGFYGMKKLVFSEAAIDGRLLSCTYSANNGMTRDTSTLNKAMPNGYICSLYIANSTKGHHFECKRAVAPIRVKPKS